MRTNIVLDDRLVKAAMKATGAKTKREVVNLGLQRLLQDKAQRGVLDLYGSGGVAADYDYKKHRSAH